MDTGAVQSAPAAATPVSTQGQQNLPGPVQRFPVSIANDDSKPLATASHWQLTLTCFIYSNTWLLLHTQLPGESPFPHHPSFTSDLPPIFLYVWLHIWLYSKCILFACSQFLKTPKRESCFGHCLPLPELCNICKFYQHWVYVFLQVVDRKY